MGRGVFRTLSNIYNGGFFAKTITGLGLLQKAQFYCYRVSAIKRLRRLLNFKAVRRSAYWKAALKRGSRLFQGQIKYSHEILKLTNFLFSVNNQELLLRYKTLYNSKTTNYFQFFIGYMLAPYIF